jgi:uridine kinase
MPTDRHSPRNERMAHGEVDQRQEVLGSVSMTLPQGEPVAGPWRAVSDLDCLNILLKSAGQVQGRPVVMAVDGRGASGKSTLAERLCQQVERSEVVHTDDIAWHEPYFQWGHLLREHILRPVRRGENVSFRPPAWETHGRAGTIEVSTNLDLLVVEGVGASQRELVDLVDVVVWVQSDFLAAEKRGIARDIALGVNGDPEESVAYWHEWMAEELRFLQQQRPWERAALIVAGTPPIPLTDGEVAVVCGPL